MGQIKAAKKQYREDLKPKCDWMKDASDARRVKPQEEMNGLMHAKASLAGGKAAGGHHADGGPRDGDGL